MGVEHKQSTAGTGASPPDSNGSRHVAVEGIAELQVEQLKVELLEIVDAAKKFNVPVESIVRLLAGGTFARRSAHGIAAGLTVGDGPDQADRAAAAKALAAAGVANPDDLAHVRRFEELLGLDDVNEEVGSARIVGRGSRASADIYLKSGTTISFESMRDFGNPTRLMLEVQVCAGTEKVITKTIAQHALVLLRAIAERHESADADAIARDWGISFLQSAPVVDTDIHDQAERWRAFCTLQTIDPVSRARAAGGHSIAEAATVLRDPASGDRFVRCGWLQAFVRQQSHAVNPRELAQLMERVGWTRRGKEGLIKATRPGGPGQLNWAFYVVQQGWEDQWEDQ